MIKWMLDLKEKLIGAEGSEENASVLCWDTLNSKKVIPGFGHTVLRLKTLIGKKSVFSYDLKRGRNRLYYVLHQDHGESLPCICTVISTKHIRTFISAVQHCAYRGIYRTPVFCLLFAFSFFLHYSFPRNSFHTSSAPFSIIIYSSIRI